MTADEAPAERLHPLAVLSQFGKAIRQMAGGLLAGGFVAFQGRPLLGLLIVGGMSAFMLVGLLLNWWRFSFRVGEDAVRIDSGIIGRNHRTLPFDRVADVSISQGPLQRLVGVAKVTLETGSSSLMGGEEGVLAAVRLDRAQALREHVRRRRGMAVAAHDGEPSDGADPAPVFAMDGRRVLTLGLFSFSLALFAGLFGISQTAGDAMNVDPFERSFWEPLLVGSGIGDYLLEHRVGFALAGLVVLIVAGIVTGIVRTALRDWNFRLDRSGRGFRRRRGLLTKTDVSLPLRRIQAGLVSTGPVRERFGFYGLAVKSLAGESGGEPGQGGGDHALAPLARWDELHPIAGDLRWRLPDENTSWRPISSAYVWSFLLLLGLILGLLAAAAVTGIAWLPDMSAEEVREAGFGTVERDVGLFTLAGLLFVGLFSFLSFLRWLEWKRTFYALEEDRLLIRTGWWDRETLLLPLRNVQTADLVEPALSRSFGVAHVVVGVAGGSWTGHRVPALPRNEATQLRRELLSRQP